MYDGRLYFEIFAGIRKIGGSMKEFVYVKAVVLGKNISGQILVQLVAQNTDGIRPFWTDRKDLICREDVFPETQKNS